MQTPLGRVLCQILKRVLQVPRRKSDPALVLQGSLQPATDLQNILRQDAEVEGQVAAAQELVNIGAAELPVKQKSKASRHLVETIQAQVLHTDLLQQMRQFTQLKAKEIIYFKETVTGIDVLHRGTGGCGGLCGQLRR